MNAEMEYIVASKAMPFPSSYRAFSGDLVPEKLSRVRLLGGAVAQAFDGFATTLERARKLGRRVAGLRGEGNRVSFRTNASRDYSSGVSRIVIPAKAVTQLGF